MGPLGVVECHPFLDDPPGLEAVTDLLEIDRLLLQAAPQPFDEDIVEVTATPILHAQPPSARADILAGSQRVRNTSIQWVGAAAYGSLQQ